MVIDDYIEEDGLYGRVECDVFNVGDAVGRSGVPFHLAGLKTKGSDELWKLGNISVPYYPKGFAFGKVLFGAILGGQIKWPCGIKKIVYRMSGHWGGGRFHCVYC